MITKVAAKNAGKSNAQVFLRWLFRKGIASLPKSGSAERMKLNLDIFDFAISEEDVLALDALEKGKSSVMTSEGIA